MIEVAIHLIRVIIYFDRRWWGSGITLMVFLWWIFSWLMLVGKNFGVVVLGLIRGLMRGLRLMRGLIGTHKDDQW